MRDFGALNALNFILAYFVFFGLYLAPGGLTYVKVRQHFLKNTKLGRDESTSTAIAAGVFWPLVLPWFALAKVTGNLDPVTRAEKAAALAEERLQAEKRRLEAEAEKEQARLRQEAAALQADLMERRRLRLAGVEVDYTDEERVELAERENKAAKDRLAIEQRKNQW